MERKPTVRIEPVEDHPNALWLRWETWVIESDVRPAFDVLVRQLDAATEPINVIVDLRKAPQLPLQTTLSETITGPFLHRNMGKWLVIGSNQRAQIIAQVATRISRRMTIFWFDNEGQALAHLETLELQRAAA